METIYTYVADDGTAFDDEDECYKYEAKLNHPNLLTIAFYDLYDKEYKINENNLFNDDVYNLAETIVIRNEEELDDFRWITKECGWYEFEQINDIGTWRRDKSGEGIWEKE